MIDQLSSLDKRLFLFLNSLHTPVLDSTMLLLSKTMVWAPLYLVLLIVIFRAYRLRSWIVLLTIAIIILTTDQVTSSFMKPFFARPRPSHEPSLEGLVHLVDGYQGGMFGFVSSHAANTFGIATFLTLLFRNYIPWMALLFLWSGLVSYTRIYLGVHYPGDILAGATVGVIVGWIGFALLKMILAKTSQQSNNIR
jgi:undecaprenyl-diphosphatase